LWSKPSGQLVQRDELAKPEAERARHGCGGGVVRDAVDPGPERASAVEAVEASPDREVDLLEEVEAPVGIGLVGPRQPLERRPESIDGLLIAGIPRAGRRARTVRCRHISGSLSEARFLTLHRPC
jgi:hypothetical protein